MELPNPQGTKGSSRDPTETPTYTILPRVVPLRASETGLTVGRSQSSYRSVVRGDVTLVPRTSTPSDLNMTHLESTRIYTNHVCVRYGGDVKVNIQIVFTFNPLWLYKTPPHLGSDVYPSRTPNPSRPQHQSRLWVLRMYVCDVSDGSNPEIEPNSLRVSSKKTKEDLSHINRRSSDLWLTSFVRLLGRKTEVSDKDQLCMWWVNLGHGSKRFRSLGLIGSP